MQRNFTYLGIDETTLGIGNGNTILVATETKDPKLIKPDYSYSLKKGKDYLRQTEELLSENLDYISLPSLPTPENLFNLGMSDYRWLRMKIGKYNRPKIKHSGIAYLISFKGYNPKEIIILIDAYHGNLEERKI